MISMDNTLDSPAKTPVGYTTQGGNYWTLITPEIWKGLYAVLQQWPWDTSRWASASCFAASCRRPGWRNVRPWWQARRPAAQFGQTDSNIS